MEEVNKSFFAIIPASIRYDNEIPSNAKLFYSEITALCNEKGYCWANNDYFTKLYNTTDRTIRRWLNILSKKGYIIVEYQYKTGTREILKRYIKLAGSSSSVCSDNSFLGEDKNVRTCGQKCPIGEDKNVRDNNINIYNNINNNICDSDEKTDESKLPEELKKEKADKYKTLSQLYSRICTNLPKILKITDKRKREIDKLLASYSLDDIEKGFKAINDSSFCIGINTTGWRADFDFCIKVDKLTNALEGKYKSNNPGNLKPPTATTKPNNKFHNFDQKIASMGNAKLEEMAKKRFEDKLKAMKGVAINE